MKYLYGICGKDHRYEYTQLYKYHKANRGFIAQVIRIYGSKLFKSQYCNNYH